MLYASHIGNLMLHLSWALRNRRYDPGVVTAVVTLTPAAVTGLRQLRSDPDISRQTLARGTIAGVALGAGLIPILKLRLKLSELRPRSDWPHRSRILTDSSCRHSAK